MGAINGMECTLGQLSITFCEQAVTKRSYLPYTLQLFTTAMTFSTVLYMGNNFHKSFFSVMCECLYSGVPSSTDPNGPTFEFALIKSLSLMVVELWKAKQEVSRV